MERVSWNRVRVNSTFIIGFIPKFTCSLNVSINLFSLSKNLKPKAIELDRVSYMIANIREFSETSWPKIYFDMIWYDCVYGSCEKGMIMKLVEPLVNM